MDMYVRKDAMTFCASVSEPPYISLVEANIIFDSVVEGEQWWVSRINVHPTMRGRGLGNKLMQALVEALGDKPIVLGINPYGEIGYEALKRFYQKFGFVEIDGTSGLMVRAQNKKEGSQMQNTEVNEVVIALVNELADTKTITYPELMESLDHSSSILMKRT